MGVIGAKDFSKRFYHEGHEAITKKEGDFLFVVASCPFFNYKQQLMLKHPINRNSHTIDTSFTLLI